MIPQLASEVKLKLGQAYQDRIGSVVFDSAFSLGILCLQLGQ